MTLEECIKSRGIAGGTVGAIAGAIIGGLLTGPLWYLGAIAGGFLGANAGAVIAILLCIGTRKDDQVSFAKPDFSSVRLSAMPDPARRNAPCQISIHYTVVGNTDRVDVDVTGWIIADDANPRMPAPPNITPNNGITFGRTLDFQTTWPREHDGRTVRGEVTLIATRGTEVYTRSLPVSDIRVAILP